MARNRNVGSHVTPLPPLPTELVEEILCRFPLKFLMQLQCVSKSWKSLISSTSFSKKHLSISTTRLHLITPSLMDYSLSSIFTTGTTAPMAQLQYPLNNQNHYHRLVGSCDGILCFAIDKNFAMLWNPTIKKFKMLPNLQNPRTNQENYTVYGFGYFSEDYMVVAVFCYKSYKDSEWFSETQSKIFSLTTNCWTKIPKDSLNGGSPWPDNVSGIFVNGTVNWMTRFSSRPWVIISLQLGNMSYKEVLQPNYGGINLVGCRLSVLRDWLCIISHFHTCVDMWVMKEYGNNKPWTKLFTVHIDAITRNPNMRALYVSDEDHVLLECWSRLINYDSVNRVFKNTEIQNTSDRNAYGCLGPKVYVESLISPCS